MTVASKPEQAALHGLLQAVHDVLGHGVAPEWQKAAQAAPRHAFLPERIWLDDGADGADGSVPCDRAADPGLWFASAYANEPVVTQVNDGCEPDDPADAWPSSSASAPSIVFQMLEALELLDGMAVLEIGTGTGFTAALMSHRLGGSTVVTIEVDPVLADQARINLSTVGFNPTVVCGDGRLGWVPRAPYDRVVATCSVQRVPPAWISQTRPGGVILTPWDNPWICGGLLRLNVNHDGQAAGRFTPDSAFMLMRTQRTDLLLYRDVVMNEHVPEESVTELDPWSVADSPVNVQFALGQRLGDVWYAWHHDPDVDGVKSRLWVATTDAGSWAAVDYNGCDDDRFTVWQHGPRRLWEEVEAAHHWWLTNGRPGPARFGLTVTADGAHTFWLDEPGTVVRRHP